MNVNPYIATIQGLAIQYLTWYYAPHACCWFVYSARPPASQKIRAFCHYHH